MSEPIKTRLEIVQDRINQYDIRFPVATLAKEMKMNKGYVSGVLNGQKPVSDNFWETFDKTYPDKGNGEPPANGHPLTGTASIQDLIASIEARRLEAVAKAEELKSFYNDVREDKKALLRIIDENLKVLIANSTKHLAYLETILRVNRADDSVIMDNQDLQAGRDVGSSTTEAGKIELAAAAHLRKKDRKSLNDGGK